MNPMINVLQLGGPAGLYGAERWILALIRNLNPKKIKSIVSVIKDDPNLPVALCKKAEKMGFETKIFTAYGKCNFSAVEQLRQYILKNDIHIIHTHQYKQDLIGLLAVRGTKCKIISTPHGWSRDAGFKLQCYEALDRLIFPFFDAVVPLSPDLYNPLKHIPFLKKKLHLIQNGVDTAEIEECTSVASELVEWKSQGYFVIGYIGQLIHRKGIDILFNAVAMLDKGIKWKMALIGDGEQKSYLEQLAKDLKIYHNVNFFGFKNNRLKFLNGFDVFVLPSRLEGIPRCLMEALAAQKIVVTSDIPGSRELIQNGKTGYSFTLEEAQNLSVKIMYVMDNSKEAHELAINGKEKIFREYSAKRMAMEYERLFSSIISFNHNGKQ